MTIISLPPRLPTLALNSVSSSFPVRPLPSFFFIHGTQFNPSLKPLTSPLKTPNSISPTTTTNEQPKQEEEDYLVLTAIRSEFNNIVILESEKSKVLLLDDSGNVHSILYKGQTWTDSYWDEFSSLPAIIPQGPVAVFGLGGGTVAHQLLDVFPSLIVEGWELDGILVDNARQFFGLSGLEQGNESGGVLRVRIGDALSSSASVAGGYAGIVVDLFSNARVLPELEKEETWVAMREKLMPNGRIMVNCGGVSGSGVFQNLVIDALCRALGGHVVNWKKMPENESGNYLAFTGPLPDLELWSESVPEKLSSSVKLWKPCEICDCD